MHAFAMAYISSTALKQRYIQDLTLELTTFASGSEEKNACFFGLVPK